MVQNLLLMRGMRIIFLLLFIFFSQIAVAQNKAVVLQNVWSNELNNYTPRDFFDKLFAVLKDKLSVKDFVADPKVVTAVRKDESWDKNVKEEIRAKKASGENAYFIAVANELRLPAFNLGKFLFKNPPRSSKLTFTLHVYDTTGTEVIGDTIINRGCMVRTIDEQKGSKYFYADYNDFVSDMKCHLEDIRKVLLEKPLAKKQKRYMETK